MFIVYRHINQNNGKSYIGITCQGITVRWRGHCGDARRRDGMCRIFHAAIRKHGEDCWDHEVLFESEDRNEALDQETKMIRKFQTTNRNFGYNITEGGERGNFGLKMSPEVGKKISERQTGIKNPNYGRKCSESDRKAKSRAMKEWHKNNISPRLGKLASKETRKKLSEAKKAEKNHFYGKKHKLDSIEKISINNGCRGLWGWKNPCTKSNESALSVYEKADIYYFWWAKAKSKNNRGRGADSLATEFGEKRKKAHITIVGRFFDGWNPLEDLEWIKFKNDRIVAS